ncbi:hypothetical protein F5884DRAFT_764962 [Xylogone sp. PMI_703]|nr:hypothetical protein F5884DRAFT_764962 [Xylogone sp. PMI_703]
MTRAENQPENGQAEANNIDTATQQPLSTQPQLVEPMKPKAPEEEEVVLTLRGGRSEACPGRFCFIIPCPFPCDFCII